MAFMEVLMIALSLAAFNILFKNKQLKIFIYKAIRLIFNTLRKVILSQLTNI
jgi:hypothetical protein